MSLLLLKNFRLVDETTDTYGSVFVENGIITKVYTSENVNAIKNIESSLNQTDKLFDGKQNLVLMPAFVDLHAHFREAGIDNDNRIPSECRILSEYLGSACKAAAAGGYGTVVCMANTNPPVDTITQAQVIKKRCDALGLIDVYPALSLTKGMEGKELSEITLLPEKQEQSSNTNIAKCIRLISEDGKDIADDTLFLSAMAEARRTVQQSCTGTVLSCHCDLDGENNATKRVLELAKKAACRLHIAHVSTKEAIAMIDRAKKSQTHISCEVTPHHIALTEETAIKLGEKSHGRVNPPLRSEEDRQALITAIADGTIDAIATDHAPHTLADKEKGAPGFSGLETAFAVCYNTLVMPDIIKLSKLSSLMSAAPARILGLGRGNPDQRRGHIKPGMRADFAIADLCAIWTVEPADFFSLGKNSPFAGKELKGKIVQTIRGGRIVFDQQST